MITSYNKMPIGVYKKVMEAADIEDAVDRTMAIISALTGKTEQEVGNIEITEFQRLVKKAQYLFIQPEKAKIKSKYICGDYELVPHTNIRKFTYNQYVDYQTFVKQDVGYTANLAAVFLVPKDCVYGEGYDLDSVIEAINNHLPITDYLALFDFFLMQLRGLMKAMRICLKWTHKKMSRKLAEQLNTRIEEYTLLLKDGDGYTMPNVCLTLPKKLSITQWLGVSFGC